MKNFVIRYTVYLLFCCLVNIFQIILIFVGSLSKDYYSYTKPDGFSGIRYVF